MAFPPATPGRDVTYRLVVHNHGPDAAERVVVSDPLPAGLSFVSASPGCAFAHGTVTCELGSLAANDSARFTVVVRLASHLTDGVVNTAHVSSDALDSDPSNNYSTVSTPVGPKADLALTKTSAPVVPGARFNPPTTVAPGGQVSYTLVATNHGPSDARDVTVSDPLPAGLTLVSSIPSQGGCTPGRDVVCHLGSLAVGGSAQVIVIARVAAGFSGSTENVAVVAGGHPDPDLSNNTARDVVIVLPPPPPPAHPVSDLGIVKSVNRATAHAGQRLTYTLRVTNHGPDTASGVQVTDSATGPLKIRSAIPSQGTCQLVPAPLRCTLGTLPVGATVTVTIIAQAQRPGRLGNTAGVTSANRDPNSANNLSATHTRITRPRRTPSHKPRPTHRPPPPRVTG